MSLVSAGGVDWYVERCGHGLPLLLIHGTGASTHSWRGLVPPLAREHEVLALDLPGHGRSGPSKDPSLPGIAAGIGALLSALQFAPRVVVGHSAGSAILMRMVADGLIAPDVVVSFNGAFLPFGGRWGPRFWSPVARCLIGAGVPGLFARHWVDERGVRRLVEQTGSRLDDDGIEAYRSLLTRPEHVAGALGMMAQWDLRPLLTDLPRIPTPAFLVAAHGDRTIPPKESAFVAEKLPTARWVSWNGVGHLAHEEDPSRAFDFVREAEQWRDVYGKLGGSDC